MLLQRKKAGKLTALTLKAPPAKLEATNVPDDLLERGKKEREEVQKVIRQEMERVLSEWNLPSRDDLLRLEEKVDRLLQRGRRSRRAQG